MRFIQASPRRRWRGAKTTRETAPAPVRRDFHAAALWVADITYVSTAEGFLNLAAVRVGIRCSSSNGRRRAS